MTVRRKDDCGEKRKSWALVTFGTAQTAAAVLEEVTAQRDTRALWRMGAAVSSHPQKRSA